MMCAAGHDMSVVEAQIAELIKVHGWTVIGAPLPRGAGHLAYTLGLGHLGMPELYCEELLIGPLSRRMNELAEAQRAAEAPWQAGQLIELRGREYRVSPIAPGKLPMVTRFYGREMPAWRVDRVG